MTEIAGPLWRRRWAGPAVVATVFLAMLGWTWQTWADLLVDFGVQLYVPWQLTEGKVLYRDIAHYTGPLSVYYNALAFRAFGVNLRVLEFANLPILIGIVAVIYYLGTRLGGKLCATICAVSFLILFAFAHLTIAGNYNFVCPYEYEYTHATLLCLLCVIFLSRAVARARLIDTALAGLFAGMVFLTRSEFLVALISAALTAAVFLIATDWRKTFPAAGFFLAAAALPPVLSILLLRFAMPWESAINGTLGMWPAVLRGNVSSQLFYLHSMGLDDFGKNLELLAAWSAAWCIPIAAFAAMGMLRTTRKAAATIVIAFLLGAVFAGAQWQHRDWGSMFRPLPLAVIAVIFAGTWRFFRNNHCQRAALATILGVFALVLMAKVFFYARIIHYGVWLAMPAVMLLVVVLFAWIPSMIRRREGNAEIFLAGIGGVWAVVLLVHLAITGYEMRFLNVPVGTGADRFWADNVRGRVVNNAILVAQQMPPGKTLACFPEGIMISYLARRPTATKFVNFNPPDLLLFGEDRMVQAMSATPPDYIFIVHKDTKEFGEKFFGRDYGQKLFAWIVENYTQVPLPDGLDLGAEPLEDNRFGIRLWVHRAANEGQQRLIQQRRTIHGDRDPRYSLTADSTSTRE